MSRSFTYFLCYSNDKGESLLLLIAILFVALLNVGLGIIVLLKNRRNSANILFSLFAMILGAWMVFNYFGRDPSLNHYLLNWLNIVTLIIPPIALYLLLLFSLYFTNIAPRKNKYFVWIGGISAVIMAYFGTTKGVFEGYALVNGINGVKFGDQTPIYMFYIIAIVVLEVGVLWYSLRNLRGLARARTKYMAISLFLTLAILIFTNLVLPFMYGIYSLIIYGLFASIIVVGGFAYAIIKLRLFDIRLVIARSIAYALLTFTLGSAYAIVTFQIGGIIFNNSSIGLPQQSFGIATAIILAFTFQPLRGFFEKITDKVFYRYNYNSQDLINAVGRILATEIELIPLSRRVRLLMAKRLHVENVNIVTLNKGKVFTESGHYVVSQLEGLAEDLQKLHGPLLVVDELLDGNKKDILNRYNISVFALLKTREGRVGYLLFGHKLSGDIYTKTDLEVIRIVADQLAVAIQNAKSFVQIQQFNNTLQGKVHDATKRLREANTSLQQLDQIKDEFITMASHQLRTPLSVSEGYLASILDGIFGSFSKQQQRALQITQEHLHITNGIISDLLNVSRMEVGRFYIDAKPVDFEDLIKGEINHIKLKAEKHGIQLEYHGPKRKVPLTNLDEQKTQQAVLNIIDNAINYSPKGKVKISLEYAGQNIIFQVKDNGIGVSEEEQPKLFSKFYRAKNAIAQRPEGTGIGLYLVKRVVEDQGGTIIFNSVQGQGSSFGFRLPVDSRPNSHTTFDSPQVHAHKNRKLTRIN